MLFPSTLVVSDTFDSIASMLKELGHISIENNPDILLITEYTVENIRTINSFLSVTPYNHDSKIVVIPKAELLNLESQNTLLKNLEEPGNNNYFILLTTRPNSLISTILSRCHVVHPQQTNSKTSIEPTTFSTDIFTSLNLSESLPKDKSVLQKYLNQQINLYKHLLVTDPSTYNANIISKLIKSLKMLDANIDTKSVGDYLLLS